MFHILIIFSTFIITEMFGPVWRCASHELVTFSEPVILLKLDDHLIDCGETIIKNEWKITPTNTMEV